MPSSRAITAAVRGWSPVIMIGRMPGAFARAHRVRRLVARRIDHADQSREDEVLLDARVDVATRRTRRHRRQPADRDAERAQRLAGQRLVRALGSRARRSAVSGRGSSPTSSRVQRASSTSGAPLVNTTIRSSRSASRCSVVISLRSDENGTSPTRGSARRARRTRGRPCAPRRAARLRSDRPAPIHRPSCSLHGGVVRAVGGRERALELRRAAHRRSGRRLPARDLAARARSPSPLNDDAPARRDDDAHRHLVLGQRAGLVRCDHARRAERLDRGEVPHDRVALRHALHAERRARPSRSPASPSGTAATASATPRMSTSRMRRSRARPRRR